MTSPDNEPVQPVPPATPSLPSAGWYTAPDGRVMWWDGQAWIPQPGQAGGVGHAGAGHDPARPDAGPVQAWSPQPSSSVPPPPPPSWPSTGMPGYPAPGQQWAGYATAPGGPPASKVAVGLLQLLPGLLLAIGGIGRVYGGVNKTLGIVMLCLSVAAWIVSACTFFFMPLVFVMFLWSVIDGIVILAGQPRDDSGRPLT